MNGGTTVPAHYVSNLPTDAREKMIRVLNSRLADAIDLSNAVKVAHWNLKGIGFIGVHELLDEMDARLREGVDTIAERCVILGGYAKGTTQTVVEDTSLEMYPIEMVSVQDHAAALKERYMAFGGKVREAIEAADDAGDEDTADLFTEISRFIDKDAWFIGAHVDG